MTFKENILIILKELNRYNKEDKETIFEKALEKRLNKSLSQYYENLDKAFDRLESYSKNNSTKLAKKLNKR